MSNWKEFKSRIVEAWRSEVWRCYILDEHVCEYELKWDRYFNYHLRGKCKRCGRIIERRAF